jgi:hypothetical protein
MDMQHTRSAGTHVPADNAASREILTASDILADPTLSAADPSVMDRVLNRLNRRRFLGGIGLAGAAFATAGITGCSDNGPIVIPPVAAAGPAPTDVLNFALNLEFLESIFYSFAVTGSLTGAGLTTTLLGGTPTIQNAPPAKIAFANSIIADLVAEICFDEVSHVKDLVAVLGGAAVRLFEDVGVSAYAGAAQYLSGQNLTYAAQILAVEGMHAASLRLAAIQVGTAAGGGPVGTTTKLPDGLDIPPADPGSGVVTAGPSPTSGGFFATTTPSNSAFEPSTPGLAYTRTTSQVLAIVYANTTAGTTSGGFFPNGVNGNIKSV